MIIDVKSVNLAFFIIFVYEISAFPQRNGNNHGKTKTVQEHSEPHQSTKQHKNHTVYANKSNKNAKAPLANRGIEAFQDRKQIRQPTDLKHKTKTGHKVVNSKNIARDTELTLRDGEIIGSMDINDENVEGSVVVPGDDNNDNEGYENDKNDDGLLQGDLKIGDKNIEGSAIIPGNGDINSGNKNDDQVNDGHVEGDFKINNENLQGDVMIPNHLSLLPSNDNSYKNNDKGNGGYMEGDINIGDEKLEGTVIIPGNGNKDSGYNNNDDVNDGHIEGDLKIDDEKLEGTVIIPGDGSNDNNYNNNDQVNDGHIEGDIKIDGEKLEGTVIIPGDVSNNNAYNDNDQKNDGHIEGDIKIDGEKLEGTVIIPGNGNIDGGYKNDDDVNDGHIEGDIKIDDEKLEGTVIIPGNGNIDGGYKNDDDVNGGHIEGDIKIDDEKLEGTVIIPGNSNIDGGYKNDDDVNGGHIEGDIKIDDEKLEGTVIIPDDDSNDNAYNNNDQANNDHIEGDLKMDDENLEGTVIIPGDGSTNNGHKDDDEVDGTHIEGDITIDDENLEGTILIPDNGINDKGSETIDKVYDDNIEGNVKIDDENIEGSVIIPDNGNNNYDQKNKGYIEGEIIPGDTPDGKVMVSIEINDKQIEGSIILPGDIANGDHIKGKVIGTDTEMNPTDDNVSGNVEINDDEIAGTIKIPGDNNDNDDDNNGSIYNGHHDADMEVSDTDSNPHDGDLSGSMEIKDDGIEGTINIPGDDDVNDDYNNGGDVNNDNNNSKDGGSSEVDENTNTQSPSPQHPSQDNSENCWMKLDAKQYFNPLDDLDAKYKTARETFEKEVSPEFDKQIMKVLLSSQGVAHRAMQQAEGDPKMIPAGINLGGNCMMRMQGSILFFHRMKLRNSTKFSVNYLHANLFDMELQARLSLNDLHLKGVYERAVNNDDPSNLFFRPNVGEIELLMKDVMFKFDGRLRMLNDRLSVAHTESDILTKDVLLMYTNDSSTMQLKRSTIEEYLDRLKTDLDLWMKDYFNDYLMYFGIVSGSHKDINEYEKKKTVLLANYADHAVSVMKKRIRSIGESVKIPKFSIFSIPNTEIVLKNGVIRGLDSMYRRSVPTTKVEKDVRSVAFTISFSNLKVEYTYETHLVSGGQLLTGSLVQSADELTVGIDLKHVSNTDAVDLNIHDIIQTKPETLTVEGPASRMIANFKSILEQPIIAIMTNALHHNVKMLNTLSRCEPFIHGDDSNSNGGNKDDDNDDDVTTPSDVKPTIDDDYNNVDTSEDNKNHDDNDDGPKGYKPGEIIILQPSVSHEKQEKESEPN